MGDSASKYKIIAGESMQTLELKQRPPLPPPPKKNPNPNRDFKSMGAFGIGGRNERGDCLIKFAEEHKLIIANTLFQKPTIDTGLGSHAMGKQEIKQILHWLTKEEWW